jgi:hypothetical protein
MQGTSLPIAVSTSGGKTPWASGGDESLLRLIGKWLHVGGLDGAEPWAPETGTAPGSVLSPLLGNVHLHYMLDLCFATEVKPRR